MKKDLLEFRESYQGIIRNLINNINICSRRAVETGDAGYIVAMNRYIDEVEKLKTFIKKEEIRLGYHGRWVDTETPIKSFFIDDNELLDSLSEKIRLGVLQEDSKSYQTNVKAKMTHYRFFNEGEGKEEFEKLKTHFPKHKITDAWGNLYNKGDSAIEHNHADYDIVYNKGQYATSGIIYLTDSETGTVFTELDITEKAEKGKVLLFSTEQLHQVPVVEEEERITIGFNAHEIS